MDYKARTLPKSRSNTRISVLTGTSSNPKNKTSESTRLVYQHGTIAAPAGNKYRGCTGRVQTGGAIAGGATGPGGAGYGSYQPLNPPSNPVEDCLRAGVAGLGWCMASWLIGVLLLVLEYARRWGAHRLPGRPYHRHEPPWLIFSPFWIGDVLALMVLARIISKVTQVRFVAPARQRNLRRADGRARSSSALNDLAGNGITQDGSGSGGGATAVALDYFPLLQRVVTTAVGGLLLLVVLTAEQLLLCLRWGREPGATGVPPIMAVAAPLLVLELFFLMRVALIRTQGWLSGVTWTLLLLLTLSVAVRSGSEPSLEVFRILHEQPWLECLGPLWALDTLLLSVAIYVAANACAGRFAMAPMQGMCFGLYTTALVLSTAAELLFTEDSRLHMVADRVPRMEYFRLDLPLLLLVTALTAFNVAVFLTAEHSVSRLINTHGYDDPLPLCQTPSGWEWSGAGKASWGLLGQVTIRAEKKVALLTGTKKSATASSTHNMNAAEAGLAQKVYQRTDSGQYVDIYDSLA